jgi:hypothetical protein
MRIIVFISLIKLFIKGVYMKKKQKNIIILITFVIAFIFLIPYIKLWIYSNYYEKIGTYIILESDKQISDLNLNNPAHLNIKSENTNDSIKVTNILYYIELKQLSFGVISNRNTFKYMELKIVDKDNNVIGELFTQGAINFYNKSLEKLYLILFESLNINEEYTIQKLDTNNNIIGEVVFSIPHK